MFFKQRSNVIFRNYPSFGYITDNRNFGYITNYENVIGEKILSESGAVFMSVLDRNPQTLDVLARKIKYQFADVDMMTIKADAKEFYSMLESEGFVVSGKTLQECDKKDTRFSYKALPSQIKNRNLNSIISRPEKSTRDYFEEYFKGQPQLTHLHIEITSRCNERCIHCYIPHDNKVSCMDSGMFYDILEQSKKMRLLHLTLSGGEPMLHKDLCDFLRKCRNNNFSISVLSNLTLLDDEIIEEMKANPLLGVQVSLYSMNPEIHDEITQVKGSFEKTKNAILELIDNDIPLQVNCPIMKQNKNCYHDVISWAKEHKIQVGDDYDLIGQYNHSTQNLDCRLSIIEIESIINEKAKNDPTFIEQIEVEAEKKKNITPNDFVCSVCHSSICISDNGNVYPCAGWQGYVVGNIKELPLIEIWKNSPKVNYLRGLRKKDFPTCIQCVDKEFCTMCMVRNANENPQGDPLIVNKFFCNIVRLKRLIAFGQKDKCKSLSS